MSGYVQSGSAVNFTPSPGGSVTLTGVTAGNYILTYLAARVNGGTIGSPVVNDTQSNSYSEVGRPIYYSNVGSSLHIAKIGSSGTLTVTVSGYNGLGQGGASFIVAEYSATKLFALNNIDLGGYTGSHVVSVTFAGSPDGQQVKNSMSLTTGDNKYNQVCGVVVLDQFTDIKPIVFAYENIGGGSVPTWSSTSNIRTFTNESPGGQTGTAVLIDNQFSYDNLVLSGTPGAGSIGTAYSFTFTAIGGATPYTFALGGSLPPGLSLNTSTGTISGTPTTAGTYSFGVVLTDSSGPPALSSSICTSITIGCPSASSSNYAYYARS